MLVTIERLSAGKQEMEMNQKDYSCVKGYAENTFHAKSTNARGSVVKQLKEMIPMDIIFASKFVESHYHVVTMNAKIFVT